MAEHLYHRGLVEAQHGFSGIAWIAFHPFHEFFLMVGQIKRDTEIVIVRFAYMPLAESEVGQPLVAKQWTAVHLLLHDTPPQVRDDRIGQQGCLGIVHDQTEKGAVEIHFVGQKIKQRRAVGMAAEGDPVIFLGRLVGISHGRHKSFGISFLAAQLGLPYVCGGEAVGVED